MKKNMLKAALIVGSISSLKAGYLETAFSYVKSGQETASKITKSFVKNSSNFVWANVPKFQKNAKSCLNSTEEAIDNAYLRIISQTYKLQKQTQIYSANSAKIATQKAQSISKYFASDDFKNKAHKTGLLICIAGTTSAAIYQALFAKK